MAAPLGPTSRRLLGFAIDFMALTVLWAIVDNVLVVPISAPVVTALSLLLFLAYFSVSESVGSSTASPGKRAMGLVVGPEDRMTIGRSVARSAIVAALVWVDWGGIATMPPFDRLPRVSMEAVVGVQLAACLFNACLVLWLSPVGEMIQDRLTSTQVRMRDVAPQVRVGKPTSRGTIIATVVMTAMVGIGTTIGFTAVTVHWVGRDIIEFFKTPIHRLQESNNSIVTTIATETSLGRV